MNSLLSVYKINKSTEFGRVLNQVSLEIKPNENLVIAGETGSGKSTLLRIIAGLEQPDAGSVMLMDEPVRGPADSLVPGHPQIAYLSQHFELPKFLRVEQVLQYASALSEARKDKIISVCKIKHLLSRKTDQLSGGEKQRIAIARLLLTHPQLLLLDEPFSHLDVGLKNTLKEVIDQIAKRLGVTCVLVSHHPEDTLPWAHRIVVLKKGSVVQRGTAQEVYQEPKTEYVARLFGACTMVSPALNLLLGGRIKKKILRPEELKVTSKKTGKWTVTHVEYFGSFYLLTLGYKNHVVKVTSTKVGWVAGIQTDVSIKG